MLYRSPHISDPHNNKGPLAIDSVSSIWNRSQVQCVVDKIAFELLGQVYQSCIIFYSTFKGAEVYNRGNWLTIKAQYNLFESENISQINLNMNEWMNGLSRQIRRISLARRHRVCTREYQDNEFLRWAGHVRPNPSSLSNLSGIQWCYHHQVVEQPPMADRRPQQEGKSSCSCSAM